MTMQIATATSTCVRVSIDRSHVPSTPMPKTHTNDARARRTPETRHAITAAAPATIHHGTPTRSCSSGSSM